MLAVSTWEGAMKKFAFAVALTLSAAAAALPQASVAQGRSLPLFEVDKAWPKLPSMLRVTPGCSTGRAR
jgi:hypothetical protein